MDTPNNKPYNDLSKGYAEAGNDAKQEKEALEWAEGLVNDGINSDFLDFLKSAPSFEDIDLKRDLSTEREIEL